MMMAPMGGNPMGAPTGMPMRPMPAPQMAAPGQSMPIMPQARPPMPGMGGPPMSNNLPMQMALAQQLRAGQMR
jgi:hypothetical protein